MYNIKKNIVKILKLIYYSYTGFRIYNLIKKIFGYKEEKKLFLKKLGYSLDLKNPRSFNQKVIWKKLFDRNPLLPIVSDKYIVRKYLNEILGEYKAKKILIPLLHVTDKPETIPFNNLEGEYVIKPNHTSHKIIFAENVGGQKLFKIINGRESEIIVDCLKAREKIIRLCKYWISKPCGYYNLAWKNQLIKRKIIVEKILRDEKGKMPEDYKFYIFHGKCQLIDIIYDRFVDKKESLLKPEWKYLDVKTNIKKATYRKKPENIESMIALAELLGKPFDFIRVDLYSIKKHIYFGEFTSNPANGKDRFYPVSFDFELGSKWKIIPKYWLHK